ncbi:putative NmeDIP very short patch repair endonuclease protein [Marine Group I thaumarchaeote SCGC AAA799-E16]|uniref:HpaII very short patch repair endonuclease protein n=2 Tax=Marine Group I TaxID=905826 RepID=A0A087RXX7_9ARCH|nr:putative NmeDIP very short patch repair endonuclease protein [Marine Group I thaumarchaeote SCGC AAA799-E16]KFM18331.1 HpaII very short patch repair endonuclease protein [Marine Group I thaumarchaeote SCGC RSA3]
MADIFTKEKRSWVMSRIRGANTGIDIKMKGWLDALGYEYMMYPKMYGNPDFVLEKEKIAIFCDGDFWHGYNYAKKKKPGKKFWSNKIERNMARDKKVSRRLRRDGYSVLRFWEHDMEKKFDICINRIIEKVFEKRH